MLELRDPVSSASHLLTALWAIFATMIMWRLSAHHPSRRLPLLVFGITMTLLYLASGLFHGLHYETYEQKRFFQKLDQTAIYFLIAGTATPIIAILLEGKWRIWFLSVLWTLALAGVACLWLLPKAPHSVVVGLYLGLGWLCILPVPAYYRAVGWRAMNWMWAGAGFYTFGAICELTQWPMIIPGWIQAHEVLHFCDTAGSVLLFLFIVRYVIPYQKTDLSNWGNERIAA